jgi:hypothetical protein
MLSSRTGLSQILKCEYPNIPLCKA